MTVRFKNSGENEIQSILISWTPHVRLVPPLPIFNGPDLTVAVRRDAVRNDKRRTERGIKVFAVKIGEVHQFIGVANLEPKKSADVVQMSSEILCGSTNFPAPVLAIAGNPTSKDCADTVGDARASTQKAISESLMDARGGGFNFDGWRNETLKPEAKASKAEVSGSLQVSNPAPSTNVFRTAGSVVPDNDSRSQRKYSGAVTDGETFNLIEWTELALSSRGRNPWVAGYQKHQPVCRFDSYLDHSIWLKRPRISCESGLKKPSSNASPIRPEKSGSRGLCPRHSNPQKRGKFQEVV